MVIDVWRPKIAVPPVLKRAVARLTPIDPHYRREAQVDAVRVADMPCLISDGFCGWHDDQHIEEAWSLLLVLRNDHGSYVLSRGVTPVPDQPAGTAILLNIHKQHKLGHLLGKRKAPAGVWLGLALDMDEPKDRRACEAMIRAKLKLAKERISA